MTDLQAAYTRDTRKLLGFWLCIVLILALHVYTIMTEVEYDYDLITKDGLKCDIERLDETRVQWTCTDHRGVTVSKTYHESGRITYD